MSENSDQTRTTEAIRDGESITQFTMRRICNALLEEAAQRVIAALDINCGAKAAIVIRGMKE